jgi:limonene-1,2-epoxide hydrolase
MTQDSNALVTAFVKLWDQPAPSAQELGAFFTEDAVYHNIPMAPVNGRAAIEKVLGGMAAGGMKSKGWEIKHQVANGDVVMNERVDRFENAGKEMSIPVVGVFVVKNGKIAEWRDYFDMAMFTNQTK